MRSIWQGTFALGFTCVVALAQSQEPQFAQQVQPLLSSKCGGCHGAKVHMSGLILDDATLILRGGQNGPVIAKGSPEKSVLLKRVKEGSMPPGGVHLTSAEVKILEDWIRAGAPGAVENSAPKALRSQVSGEDRKFWSFRPLSHPEPPKVKSTVAVATPVDAFLLAKLEEKKLNYAKASDRAALVRRAYLDLLGLPPGPEEIDAFVKAALVNASGANSKREFAALVDRLLASEHFGERWGRHWLDLAGYVDTVGRDVQSTGYKVGEGRWKYRDYVISAFNHDKPYNQFLTEQIAGDETFDWRNATRYTPAQVETLVATGFLRTAEDPTDNSERDTPLLRYEVMHQTEEILSSSVLGLTVGCARCHDHKFDPIPQRDYYSLMATLAPAYNPVKWTPVLERVLADVPPATRKEIDKANEELDKSLEPLRTSRTKLLNTVVTPMLDGALEKIPEAKRANSRKAALVAEADRTPAQKKLVAALGLDLSEKSLIAHLAPEQSAELAALDTQIAALACKRQKYGVIEALYDTGAPPETFIHRRGDFESKGDVVQPAGLEVLSKPGLILEASATGKPEGTSGRRRALANWMTEEGTPASALVARVYVNRVWMHLFGTGIVATPENFGKLGAQPTHPELLDWLATEFVRNGWSTKHLIRTIMLSTAYQQSSRPSDSTVTAVDPAKVDPDDALLWHMPLRRLESEVVRDSMLTVSGMLNRTVGGEPVKTIAEADGMVTVDEKSLKEPADRYRRSVYLVARRRFNLTMLGVFDHPVMSTNATTRGASAVVLQSLMMMNDKEVLEQSAKFADRVVAKAGPKADDVALLRTAWRFAIGRAPEADELQWATGLLARERDRYRATGKPGPEHQALASVCHVLFNTNEFLYVE